MAANLGIKAEPRAGAPGRGLAAFPPPELCEGFPHKTPADQRGLESQRTSFH